MAEGYASDLARKLNVKQGQKLHVVGKPGDVDLDGLPTASADDADGVMVFVRTLAEVDATCEPLVEAARADRLAWAVYPKAGKLGTDLNRDILWRHLLAHGIQGIRQIALDEVWSAVRFRPSR